MGNESSEVNNTQNYFISAAGVDNIGNAVYNDWFDSTLVALYQ